MCLQTAGSTHFMIGWEDAINKGGPVTINVVSLTDPHNLVLSKTTLVNMTHLNTKNLIGLHRSWTPRAFVNDRPPGGGPTIAQMLDAQVPTVGYTIAAGEHVGLVEYVETDSGWAGPVRIKYTDSDGGAHLWVGGSTLSIKPECS